ncbi:glucosaminidase domain-containing protein [Alicyclobacillus shizuokensis]|uniref:glucosaminidase domain-containing protein n=1 Tax=Alicyclobacillus shizuokensis TaxID=392014 RepID=UPI00082D6637|nr:glucosaminidase domain-containing protein [Alicyclobacillus shizuokensis]
MQPKDFIALVAPSAVAFFRAHKISAALIIAQAALESGWGKYAPGNNLFGIKADSSWHGPVVTETTTEYIGGRSENTQAKFRAYPSLGDSIQDHGQFLLANSRYHNLIGAEWRTACELIQKDGYATDPQYAQKLIAVIEQYKLYQYDSQAAQAAKGGEEDVQVPTLQQGVTGHTNAVKAVQAIVGVKTDGVFGPVTKTAVQKWQSAHGLTADGIVGPQTWGKMLA